MKTLLLISALLTLGACNHPSLNQQSSRKMATVDIIQPGEGPDQSGVYMEGTGNATALVSGISASILTDKSLIAEIEERCSGLTASANRECLTKEIKIEITNRLNRSRSQN